MIKTMYALLCAVLVCIASVNAVSAKDNRPIGYTAITGIKAGLWVAEEAGIFEKYNIQPHLILITSGSKMVQAMLGGDLPLAGAAGKDSLMDRIARAMHFPRWFGGNWDALEDCLTDLSWSKAPGHVLLIEDAKALPRDERGILVDSLASAAASWAERKRPFFAVFLDGPPALPELYKSRR